MTMFIALAVLLGAAKLAGEIMQKLDQPSVLGEIMAGILLGPTVLGHFKPAWYAFIFPATGNLPIVLETVTTLGVVFFLLTAGLEIDLATHVASYLAEAEADEMGREQAQEVDGLLRHAAQMFVADTLRPKRGTFDKIGRSNAG